jgi:hypothetical protein
MDTKAQHFEEKINGIHSSFLSALDDFKKYYVYYHKNPEVDEYSNNFVNSKNQLQQVIKRGILFLSALTHSKKV